ncbi:MAG: hypothetical protein R6X17_02430 [Candidatus Competibacteraceae bacterium]
MLYRLGSDGGLQTALPIIALYALAAYPGAERDDPRALESFKVGCHHRITRRALVEWLARNRNARRGGV